MLITDPAAAPERPTDDVDLIVELTSASEFHRLGKTLRALGFREDTSEGAPICRWIVASVRVDVMPAEGPVLGFRNRWYREAITHAIEANDEGVRFRIVDAPHFCATKLDAFDDRGGGDIYHHDLEDIVAIVDGRASLETELAASGDVYGGFVAKSIQELLDNPRFLEALPGHLPGDAGSQARLPTVLARLRRLAALI